GHCLKLDPIAYVLNTAPDPREPIVYRGGTEDQPYILFQPRPLDLSISYVAGFDLYGNEVPHAPGAIDASLPMRCCHFQGRTGMTGSEPGGAWTSWLGSVLYDSESGSIIVVFRGSRSGDGGRALKQALVDSKGNPDWVTDMDHLNEKHVQRFGEATLAAGFWLAYQSCKPSLTAAFHRARAGGPIEEIYFTGHSLGGALAQCAYLDFAAGDFLSGSDVQGLKKTKPIYCYPISAPPVVLGKESVAKIQEKVTSVTMNKELHVYHYFADKDAVHGGKHVTSSLSTFASSAVAFVTHPTTSACHLGIEHPLASTAAFPDAHEPDVVRKAMLAELNKAALRLDREPDFWPLLALDVTCPGAPKLAGWREEARMALE